MNRLKILIVEDNPAIASLLQEMLMDEGWQVMTARDGPQAIDMARLEMPDVILLDVMMPRMDGFAVCRTIHGDPPTSRIKIIMVTVLSGKEDMEKAMAAGAADFIVKPFDGPTLIDRIKKVVNL